MASAAAAGSNVTTGRKAEAGAPPSASVMADRRGSSSPGGEGAAVPPARRSRRQAKTPNYTAFFAAELVELGKTDRRIVGDHGRHADRHRPGEVPGRVPGPVHRRRHRRAARGDARHGPRPRRHAPGRRAVLDVPPAGVRPDGPRRVPERRPGAAGGRPRGPRRRGRHQPPGHVHAARRSGCCRTSSSRARGTSRSCARCSARRSPRTTRSRSTIPRDAGLRRARARAGGAAGRAWRGAPRGPGPAVRDLRPDHRPRPRGRRRARGTWLVRGRASTPGSSSRSTAS